MNREQQVNNWLISRLDHYFLVVKVKNNNHGVTAYTNISTSSKSHPGHPFPPTITQCDCDPHIEIYIKVRQLVMPEIGTLIYECSFASENTFDT